ncbi:MAG: hypothetical protein AAF748_04975 [Pseudomonadota bacterium]
MPKYDAGGDNMLAALAQMLAYPGHCVIKTGRALLNEVDPGEAAPSHQVDGDAQDPITLISAGRINCRDVPVQQTLENWNDLWSEYKNA